MGQQEQSEVWEIVYPQSSGNVTSFMCLSLIGQMYKMLSIAQLITQPKGCQMSPATKKNHHVVHEPEISCCLVGLLF